MVNFTKVLTFFLLIVVLCLLLIHVIDGMFRDQFKETHNIELEPILPLIWEEITE